MNPEPSVQGTLGIKRPERDADDSPTSIAKEHTSVKLQPSRLSVCTSDTVSRNFLYNFMRGTLFYMPNLLGHVVSERLLKNCSIWVVRLRLIWLKREVANNIGRITADSLIFCHVKRESSRWRFRHCQCSFELEC